jgi:hypothetical protein
MIPHQEKVEDGIDRSAGRKMHAVTDVRQILITGIPSVRHLPVFGDHEIQNSDKKNESTDDEFKFFILFFEFEPLLLIDE